MHLWPLNHKFAKCIALQEWKTRVPNRAESTEWQTASDGMCVYCILAQYSYVWMCMENASMLKCWSQFGMQCSVWIVYSILLDAIVVTRVYCAHNTWYNISSIRKVAHTIIKIDPPIFTRVSLFFPNMFVSVVFVIWKENEKIETGIFFFGSRKHLKWYPNK